MRAARTVPWIAPVGSLTASRTATPARVRCWSLLLFLSLLPMLTFIDHMELRVDIPFTGYYFGVERAAEGHSHAHSHAVTQAEAAEDEAHDHASHCHISVASCSDVPLTSIGGFALLNESAALLGAASLTLALALAVRLTPRSLSVLPETPPPR